MDVKIWLRAQWDRVLGGVGIGIGLLALLLGYQGVADTPFPAEQLPYIVSGGLLGIALIGIGLTSWLSADLRDEWRKLDRIERLLDRGADDDPVGPTAQPTPTRASVGVTTDAKSAAANGSAPATRARNTNRSRNTSRVS